MSVLDSTVEYREIQGFPGYRVGNDGSVWSCLRSCIKGRIITDQWRRQKPGASKKRTAGRRYLYVNLATGQRKYKTFRIHRLVLQAFVGPCPEGMEARHLNGDPSDNRLENLCWGTPGKRTVPTIRRTVAT